MQAGSPSRTITTICLFISTVLLHLPAGAGRQSAATPALTLPAAIEEMLRSSPLARAARYARDAALARAEKDRPISRPSLEADIGGTLQGPRAVYPAPTGFPNTVVPEEAGRLDLVLEETLLHAGVSAARVKYESEKALANLDYRKALAEMAATMQKLMQDGYRAYSGVRVAHEGVVAATSYLDLVKASIAAGSVKPVDLQTAQAQLAEAEAGLAQAESGEKVALMAINQEMGRPLDAPITLPEQASAAPPDRDVSGAVAAATRDRVEVVELRLELAAAKAGVDLARSESRPSLVARGQLTEQTPTAFVHEHYAAATLEIRLPILDGGKTKQDMLEARAEVQRLEALLEAAKSGVGLDVRQAQIRVEDAGRRLTLAATQLEGAEAASRVALAAYTTGRATAIEVQAAAREVRLARYKQADVELELAEARDAYRSAQGLEPPEIDRTAPLFIRPDLSGR